MIIEVLGGVVQNVAVNEKDVRVVVVDWDNITATKNSKEQELEWQSLHDLCSLAPETTQLYQRLLEK